MTAGASSPRRLLTNFGWLTAGRVAGDLCTFVMFVTLSRVFGAQGIGQYSFAMGLTGLLAVLSDFGLNYFTVKELEREPGSFQRHYSRIVAVRLLLAAVFLILLLAGAPFLPFAPATRQAVMLIGTWQIFYRVIDGLGNIFIAREENHLAAVAELGLKAGTAAAATAAALAGAGFAATLALLPAWAVAHTAVMLLLVVVRCGRPRLLQPPRALGRLLVEAWPYAAANLPLWISMRMDVVLLGFIMGELAAGAYNVAYRLVFPLMFLPHFASFAIFPSASRLFHADRPAYQRLYHRAVGGAVLAGVPMAAGLALTADRVIPLVFGEAFLGSIPVLRLLAALPGLAFVNHTMGVFLMSADRERSRMHGLWLAAGVNVSGNLLLIPIHGITGAAAATVISECALMLHHLVVLTRLAGRPQAGSRVLAALSGAGLFSLGSLVLPGLPLPLLVAGAALLYLAVLLLVPSIRRQELGTVRRIFRGGGLPPSPPGPAGSPPRSAPR